MSGIKFVTEANLSIEKKFLNRGYLIVPSEDKKGLKKIQNSVADITAKQLSIKKPHNTLKFLNNIHQYLGSEKLNDLRVAVLNELNTKKWIRPTYFNLAKLAIERLVGNELAMQRRLGLNIQFPNDDSSLLPVHADVWDGDSPFEIVMWVPLVDCFASKSMYIMEPIKNRQFQKTMTLKKYLNAEDIFNAIENDVKFIDIAFGNILLFTQTIMHGNRVNYEDETRWSMNCRFKSLLSPYADKKLGEFFEPITVKPATRLGMTYELPEKFNE